MKATDFAPKLKAHLKKIRMTQTALAERSGLHFTTISMFTHGRRIPKLDTVIRILAVLDLTLEELMG